MINCLFVHNFAYFSLFFWKPVFSKIYLNKFKLHHLCMYLYLCVWINLYNNIIILAKAKMSTYFLITLNIAIVLISFYNSECFLVLSNNLLCIFSDTMIFLYLYVLVCSLLVRAEEEQQTVEQERVLRQS